MEKDKLKEKIMADFDRMYYDPVYSSGNEFLGCVRQYYSGLSAKEKEIFSEYMNLLLKDVDMNTEVIKRIISEVMS